MVENQQLEESSQQTLVQQQQFQYQQQQQQQQQQAYGNQYQQFASNPGISPTTMSENIGNSLALDTTAMYKSVYGSSLDMSAGSLNSSANAVNMNRVMMSASTGAQQQSLPPQQQPYMNYMYQNPVTFIVNSSNIQPIPTQIPNSYGGFATGPAVNGVIPTPIMSNPQVPQQFQSKPPPMQPFQFQSQLQQQQQQQNNTIYSSQMLNGNGSTMTTANSATNSSASSNNSNSTGSTPQQQSTQQQMLMNINPMIFQQQMVQPTPTVSSIPSATSPQQLPQPNNVNNSSAPTIITTTININESEGSSIQQVGGVSSVTASASSTTTTTIKRKRGRPPKLNKDGTPVNPALANQSHSNGGGASASSHSNGSSTINSSSSEQSSPTSANSPTQDDKSGGKSSNKSRAIYLCNKCKLPKKGHSCSNKSPSQSGASSGELNGLGAISANDYTTDDDESGQDPQKKFKSDHSLLKQSETISMVPDMGIQLNMNDHNIITQNLQQQAMYDSTAKQQILQQQQTLYNINPLLPTINSSNNTINNQFNNILSQPPNLLNESSNQSNEDDDDEDEDDDDEDEEDDEDDDEDDE